MPRKKREIGPSLSSKQKAKVTYIVKRLKGSKSVFDVLDWLFNFTNDKYDQALSVLEKLEYFTENDIISLLNDRIKELIKRIQKGLIVYFVPIGDFGKSSYLVAYYLKKTTAFKDFAIRNTVHFVPSTESLKTMTLPNNKYHIVFYDDFLGSGGSLIDFRTDTKNSLIFSGILKKRIEYIICLLYIDKSSIAINKSFPNIKIIGEQRFKVFHTDRSIFGSRESMRSIREFCFDEGKGLFYTKEKRKRIDHPLGYKNSQGILAFAHGTPNNTLPIIWSGNRKDGRRWVPLFPRQSFLRINEAKQLRNNIAFELSILKEFGFDYYDFFKTMDYSKNFNYAFISQINFLNYAVLKMIRRKRPIPLICMDLGIALSDYEEVLQRLIDQGIMKIDTTLTMEGYNVINEVRTILNDHRNKLRKYRDPVRQRKTTIYLPKTFNGSS